MLKQDDPPEKCHKELDEVHDAVVLGERNLSGEKRRRGNYWKSTVRSLYRNT